MKKRRNIVKILLVALLMLIGTQATVKATQQPTMYVHYMDTTGKTTDNPMDAVVAVKTTSSSLSGVAYNSSTKVLTLNGLQADTLRIYAKKVHLQGTTKVTNFSVNTKIESVTADNGSSFSCTNKEGKKCETFFNNLPKDTTSSGTTVSKGNISLDKTAVAVYAAGSGNTVALKATTQGSGTVKWTSSNTSVATVSNGTVKGVKAGTATITATLVNSNNAEVAKATCTVTVKAPTITLNSTSSTIYVKGVGSTVTLTATANGATSGNTITWASSNTAVATVSNGSVKGVKAGTTTITATANGVKATCKVTVKAPTLTLSKEKATIYTKGEKTVTITATVNGTAVSGANVTWSSSDNSIAKVENGKVTAVAVGTATITAKVNGVSKKCTITVKKPTISVSPTSVTIKKGKTVTLKATVRPTSGKPTYSTSKKSVATVTDAGVIKGVAAGEATITAKCNGATATVKVTVTK